MTNSSASKSFILYRLYSVALDLRVFSVAELNSLVGATASELDNFVTSGVSSDSLAWREDGRLTLSNQGLSHFLSESLVLARVLLQTATRTGSSRSTRSREHDDRPLKTQGNKFREALLIAARTEALLHGAAPKIDIGRRRKASRIAEEEFRQNLLAAQDYTHLPVEPEAEEEELFFEESDSDVREEQGGNVSMRMPLRYEGD